MPLTEDSWLSQRFGHPVFSVDASEAPAAAAREAAEHAREAGTASYQARIRADRPETSDALTEVGFALISVGLDLAREPGKVDPAEMDPGPDRFEVREADPERDLAVLGIAERGFSRTRFHLDPRIPRRVADRVKRDWAENSLTGVRGDGMLVAVREGEPVGFLAGLSSDAGDRRAHVIDLMAVTEAARGEGAGRALVARFLGDAEGGYDEVRVTTQEANPDATRFYRRLGFEPTGSALDLHLHAGDPWPGE